MASLSAPSVYAGGLILATRRPPVTTIVLNSPETRNTLNSEGARALAAALRAADADPETMVIVIAGNGGNFCSGADMMELTSGGEYFPWAGPQGPLQNRPSKPTIAAIEGYATAEGLGLALLSDIRIVDTTATFGVFGRRLGLTGDGTASRLTRLVGIGQAMDILLTGRAIGCDRAMTIGLATRKVANGGTRQMAEKIAQEMGTFAPMALMADRWAAYLADAGDATGALRAETQSSPEIFAQEGRAAVAELMGVAYRRSADEVLSLPDVAA